MRNLITKIYYPATNTHVWFRNGRRVKTMDKKFNTIVRKGIQLDMYQEIEDLQAEYYADLQASVDSFDLYAEVANETSNDFARLEKVIRVFERLGYLYRDEANGMIEAAREQRRVVLESLEVNK